MIKAYNEKVKISIDDTIKAIPKTPSVALDEYLVYWTNLCRDSAGTPSSFNLAFAS